MQAFRTLGRCIRDAFKSVYRNFSLSIASITCITITLIIVAFSIIVSDNVNNFTKGIEKDVTIVVFVATDAKEEEITFIDEQIRAMDNVISDQVVYTSKEAIKEMMSESNEEFEKALGSMGEGENPLRDTYKVKVKDITKIKNTADEIKTINKVHSVQYGEGVVEKLVNVFDAVEKGTVIAAAALSVVTIFLIVNTIKLTVFSRRTEISIMRLVGASNFRIKFPFVIEGIILGIIGSITPILITIFGYKAIYNYFGGIVFSTLIKLVEPEPFIYFASLILVGIGMIVGMFGSGLAVRRYIKVWKK